MAIFDSQFFSATQLWKDTEIFNMLLDVQREGVEFLDIMDMIGRAVPTKNSVYHQFHMTNLFGQDTVNTVTDLSGGSGQGDVQIVLTAANGTSNVIKNSYVLFPSGYMGFVYDKTPDAAGDIIKVKAVNPSVTTALLAVANGQILSYPSVGSGEGSGNNEYQRWAPQKFANQVGHLNRTIVNITDIGDAETMEFEYEGKKYVFFLAEAAGLRKFRMEEAFYFLTSQISDANFSATSPTLTDADGKPVQSTSGLEEQISLYGITDTGITPNNTAFNALTLSLAAARAPQDYFIFAGQYGMNKLQDWAAGLSAANQVSDKIRFNVDGNEVDLDVMAVRVYGHNFYLKRLGALDHAQVLNYTGSAGFEKKVYFIPTGNTQTFEGKTVPYFQYRYMSGGKAGDWRYFTTADGAILKQSGHIRQGSIAITSIIGLEVNGAQVMARWDLA